MSSRSMRTSLRLLIVGLQISLVACGSSSAPSSPTPIPVTPAAMIAISACPDTVTGLDVGFYRQIGCNAFDQPLQSVRRWNVAPKLYIRTIDEAGAALDAVTLDTVQTAMVETAGPWTAGRYTLTVERGTASMEGQSGWITVKWPTISDPTALCGRSDVAQDGGTIELNYKVGGGCACNGSAIRPRTARHELGHALGYWHTDRTTDLMSSQAVSGCDAQPSARELQAASYQYR